MTETNTTAMNEQLADSNEPDLLEPKIEPGEMDAIHQSAQEVATAVKNQVFEEIISPLRREKLEKSQANTELHRVFDTLTEEFGDELSQDTFTIQVVLGILVEKSSLFTGSQNAEDVSRYPLKDDLVKDWGGKKLYLRVTDTTNPSTAATQKTKNWTVFWYLV